MKKPIFAGNWKMHHGPEAAAAFMDRFLSLWEPADDRTILIFPPAISLSTVSRAVAARPDITVGVQNIYWEEKGAFTGEISVGMAREAGATVVLVGHSERRHVFGESDEETARKVAAAAAAGLTPMLCVGELLEEREAGHTEAVVLRQLRAGVARLDAARIGAMAVAYEPVWAIGTGRTATPEDAAAVHMVLRRALREMIGDGADQIPLLYGGSVNRGNVTALLSASEVDGVLVGGASLEADGWAALVQG